jgi:hypothetical protein
MKKFTAYLLLFASIGCIVSCSKDDPDPVVKALTLSATKDASIFNADGSYNENGSGGSDIMRVGYSDEYGYIVRSLVAFDVSSIPKNVKIISASLVFTIGKSGNNVKSVFVHKLTQNWTEGASLVEGCDYADSYCREPGASVGEGNDVTWLHTQYSTAEWTTSGGTFASTPSASVPNGGMGTFSSQGLVDDVKAWMSAPDSNFGWILKVDEDAIDGSGGEQIRYLTKDAAANGAAASTKPSLVIVYQQ